MGDEGGPVSAVGGFRGLANFTGDGRVIVWGISLVRLCPKFLLSMQAGIDGLCRLRRSMIIDLR